MNISFVRLIICAVICIFCPEGRSNTNTTAQGSGRNLVRARQPGNTQANITRLATIPVTIPTPLGIQIRVTQSNQPAEITTISESVIRNMLNSLLFNTPAQDLIDEIFKYIPQSSRSNELSQRALQIACVHANTQITNRDSDIELLSSTIDIIFTFQHSIHH